MHSTIRLVERAWRLPFRHDREILEVFVLPVCACRFRDSFP